MTEIYHRGVRYSYVCAGEGNLAALSSSSLVSSSLSLSVYILQSLRSPSYNLFFLCVWERERKRKRRKRKCVCVCICVVVGGVRISIEISSNFRAANDESIRCVKKNKKELVRLKRLRRYIHTYTWRIGSLKSDQLKKKTLKVSWVSSDRSYVRSQGERSKR